jgi:hypothetical protein
MQTLDRPDLISRTREDGDTPASPRSPETVTETPR